ncbi:3-isopropylmalate dehydratase small subunit [bacterium]|nr:3-isopropylmalate dehydratase small subunit [bacterium]MBU3956145.1 3-isopropylmalate dehydratase small subunit [bacterium]MBU4134441.1 3-isopropylmalate dehydratase small subunit [bacterium]
MKNIIKGHAYVVGDSVDTDVIIPARFLTTDNAVELAAHCMEDLDKDFRKKVKSGDIIVAGDNFGCGSSREHAPIAIKASGISAVIAKSFARIFFRNCINIGLMVFVCDIKKDTRQGDEITVNMGKGEIVNARTKKVYTVKPVPEFIKKIVAAGGLLNYAVKRRK